MSNEETAPYGSGAAAQAAPRKRIRTHHLREMKERGEKITMLTAYDMFTAATFDEAAMAEIRRAAVLAVGDLGDKSARKDLQAQMDKEKDGELQSMMRDTLKKL